MTCWCSKCGSESVTIDDGSCMGMNECNVCVSNTIIMSYEPRKRLDIQQIFYWCIYSFKNLIMNRFMPILAVLLLSVPVYSWPATDTEICVQKCLDAEVVTPPAGAVFPHKITFENSADQAGGNAAILFRTIPDGTVKAVTVNGEAARLGKPYKGASVFLLSKPGEQYSRPLKFTITTSDGKSWTATSGSEGPSVPGVTGNYKYQATYTSYGVRNGGRQAWRIPKKGPDFGQPIKFVFSSGKSFTVRDTSKNCRDQESCSRNAKAPMYGFVFKPGIGPNGDGDADTGTSHGGVYLHAPYGDRSQTVTVHYNGK